MIKPRQYLQKLFWTVEKTARVLRWAASKADEREFTGFVIEWLREHKIFGTYMADRIWALVETITDEEEFEQIVAILNAIQKRRQSDKKEKKL